MLLIIMYESRDLIIIMYDASRLEQCVVESMLIIRLGNVFALYESV
jgi:hypothetical protein